MGLVPQDAIELSAAYYMEKDNLFLLEEDQKIRLVSFNCHRIFVVVECDLCQVVLMKTHVFACMLMLSAFSILPGCR